MKLKTLIETRARQLAEIHEAEASRDSAAQEIKNTVQRGHLKRDLPRLGTLGTLTVLMPEHIYRLNRELGDTEEEITEALRVAVRCWNTFVASRTDEIFESFIAAVRPFFGGIEKDDLTRREFSSLFVPRVAETRRAAFELGDFVRLTIERRIETAERFLKHVAEKCKALDWPEPNLEAAPSEPAPSIAVQPKKMVRVRVLETVTLPCLGIKDASKRQKMHSTWAFEQPDRQLKAGEVIEVEQAQLPVLARFLEPVSEPAAK